MSENIDKIELRKNCTMMEILNYIYSKEPRLFNRVKLLHSIWNLCIENDFQNCFYKM